MKEFLENIDKFHDMCGLPKPNIPTLYKVGGVQKRLKDFQKVIQNEINEGLDIFDKTLDGDTREIEILTELADWFGDIIVYCTSEARRYGIPIDKVLEVIMQSNFSKLAADDTPIIFEGKVQKGPNYWKPEPKIKEVLMLEYHTTHSE
jgi:predicted HAD superfamily Cof-like phosphohydrolase